MKLKKLKRLIKGNLIVLLILLVITEIGLRIAGNETYPGAKPNIAVKPGGKYFMNNDLLGYKHLPGEFTVELNGNYEFITTHNKNSLRLTGSKPLADSLNLKDIWVIGCSFTHGWSINDEETFPWLMQTELPDYRVTNWGTNGYGTIHFYLQIKNALEQGETPDYILLNHADFHTKRNAFSYGRRRNVSRWNFLGDLNQPYTKIDAEGELQIAYSEEEYNAWWLSRYSTLVNFGQYLFEGYQDLQGKSDEFKMTAMLLDRIQQLCTDHGVKLMVTNIGKDPIFIQEFCQENGIAFKDIALDLSIPENNNWPHDGHPNAHANRIYAERILSLLKAEGL